MQINTLDSQPERLPVQIMETLSCGDGVEREFRCNRLRAELGDLEVESQLVLCLKDADLIIRIRAARLLALLDTPTEKSMQSLMELLQCHNWLLRETALTVSRSILLKYRDSDRQSWQPLDHSWQPLDHSSQPLDQLPQTAEQLQQTVDQLRRHAFQSLVSDPIPIVRRAALACLSCGAVDVQWLEQEVHDTLLKSNSKAKIRCLELVRMAPSSTERMNDLIGDLIDDSHAKVRAAAIAAASNFGLDFTPSIARRVFDQDSGVAKAAVDALQSICKGQSGALIDRLQLVIANCSNLPQCVKALEQHCAREELVDNPLCSSAAAAVMANSDAAEKIQRQQLSKIVVQYIHSAVRQMKSSSIDSIATVTGEWSPGCLAD